MTSVIMGKSSAMNVLVSIIKYKIAALLLGPPGEGLIARLSSIMPFMFDYAGLGLRMSHPRQFVQLCTNEWGEPCLPGILRNLLLHKIVGQCTRNALYELLEVDY